MKSVLIFTAALNVIFIFMHEFDAFRQGEWKMFSFLKKFSEEMQYRIFLWIHFPLCIIILYYIWCIIHLTNFPFWFAWNVLMIAHLAVHLVAIRWKSNVFKDALSFIFITGCGITGAVNIILSGYYVVLYS